MRPLFLQCCCHYDFDDNPSAPYHQCTWDNFLLSLSTAFVAPKTDCLLRGSQVQYLHSRSLSQHIPARVCQCVFEECIRWPAYLPGSVDASFLSSISPSLLTLSVFTLMLHSLPSFHNISQSITIVLVKPPKLSPDLTLRSCSLSRAARQHIDLCTSTNLGT